MLSEMSAAELAYWQTVYSSEFLGDERGDYRAAQIAATVANFAGKTLKDSGKSIAPLDLMTFVKRAHDEPQPTAPVTQDAIATQVHSVFGILMQAQAEAAKAKAEKEKEANV